MSVSINVDGAYLHIDHAYGWEGSSSFYGLREGTAPADLHFAREVRADNGVAWVIGTEVVGKRGMGVAYRAVPVDPFFDGEPSYKMGGPA